MHKLLMDDFYDATYTLFAVHCRLEDYRLAYLLNRHLDLKLKRKPQDLDFNYFSTYPIYEWDNAQEYMTWNLVSNVCKKEEASLYSTGVLFGEEDRTIKTYNLISEFKRVDFFIKISSEAKAVNEKLILNKLQAIPQIITSYEVDLASIKHKEYLIF
ncbi:IPExxxVDY family protein [Winogradskyella maritima]|uniref:IPExxxVDY family protein n=1 Tax=Winogradskyella maritima TaxID=1517766 RepID=A0ABV8AE11_9FLAO|nr:IPExxxVDY family protein [Winogradskyella maritima]